MRSLGGRTRTINDPLRVGKEGVERGGMTQFPTQAVDGGGGLYWTKKEKEVGTRSRERGSKKGMGKAPNLGCDGIF